MKKAKTSHPTKNRPTLARTTFTTSRLLDFFSDKELTAQIGHPKSHWPLAVLVELTGNAIDACEDVAIAPVVTVKVDKSGITVQDNGPGLPAETVTGILDFSVRVSSREHYVSPTRGAQGNALKTIVAMPFVLDGNVGRVDICARGVRHEIRIKVDRIKQEPVIDPQCHKDRFVKKGTRVQVYWPDSSSSILHAARERFLQVADDFTWCNPHLTLTVDWFGESRTIKATSKTWPKWLPRDPTSPHWYTLRLLERLVAGYITEDERKGRTRTVREFVAEFSGLTGTAKQKAVLDATGLSRMDLTALRNGDGLDERKLATLLAAMKANTRPIKPEALGLIGKDHLAVRFEGAGCEMKMFKYRKLEGESNGVPTVLEIAFAATHAAFKHTGAGFLRRLITGVNWAPALGATPFRQLGHESLDSILQEQRAGYGEPVVFFMHLASARPRYTDRGKSAVILEADNQA
ncbi:MAG TPA: hypothetical protein VFA18_17535 [Gemmataceae bacterium]|nr:hypothetical protein [Gemmataceae bacterium]